MADEGNVISNLDIAPNGEDTAPLAGVISQYVKDLSVENPNAPDCYQWQEAPDVDVQFNIASRQINEEVHEVELKIMLTAKTSTATAYAVELAYCGLAAMRNLPHDQGHAFIFAEVPRILFPFARRIIADAVRDAGFAPVMLEPIDFTGLYLQQLAARQAETGDDAGAGAGDGQPVGNA